LHHTTELVLEKIFKEINPSKASDIYKIKPAIVKDLGPFLIPILTTLFNRTIDESEYPDPLKLTKVIELYKTKDKTNPLNYRPISLLPIIGKILDIVINKQLMHHLTSHNIISPTQYAFRPNSSTTLALQTIINEIYKQKSKRKPTLAVYVDLSKAYDTISHKKLLHKLEQEFNFSTDTVTYFRSYLSNRKQSTHTQHAQSRIQTITHGVPQGSTLSTTFFLLYVNNIIQTVPNSKVYTYADDTTLIITADSMQDLQSLAQSELNNLINYFYSNNLVPNPTKTNYTFFYPTHSPKQTLQLNIGTTVLKHHTEAKLLGIVVQHQLKHHPTVANILKKLRQMSTIFRYANKFLPTRIMRQLYFTHVYPHFIGAIAIWGTEKQNRAYLQPLIRIQKKFVRLIKKLPPKAHTKPIMKELRILTLPNLYILRVCAEMHPFMHTPDQEEHINRPTHNHNYTKISEIHEYKTRQSSQQQHYISNPHHNSKESETQLTTEYLTRNYTQVWNTLPLELRQLTSQTQLKTKLKEYLLTQQNKVISNNK
jgi:hypothetical protein